MRLEPRLGHLGPQLVRLEPRLVHLEPRLVRLEPQLVRIATQLDHLEPPLDHLALPRSLTRTILKQNQPTSKKESNSFLMVSLKCQPERNKFDSC